MESLRLPWVLVCDILFASSKSGVFPSVLWSSYNQAPLTFKEVLLMPDPHAGETGIGLRALAPVGGLIQYNYSPVCDVLTWVRWDLTIL